VASEDCGLKNGAIIMSAFAALWWVVAIRSSGNGSALLYCVPMIVTALIVGVAWRLKEAEIPPEESKRIGRLVGGASAVEGVLIGLSFAFLTHEQVKDFGASLVAIIVGLHFLPLAHWLPAKLYYGSAAVLVVLGVAALGIGSADLRILVVSIGAACALWLTSAIRLSSAVRIAAQER
jgi:hypothetical protein